MAEARAEAIERTSGARAERSARLGFLGVGWIGLSRMRAVVQSGAAEVASGF